MIIATAGDTTYQATYRVVGVFDATTDEEISRDVRFWLDVLGQGTSARVVGEDLILDSDDLEVLADLTPNDDGVYADGYVWVSGQGYEVHEVTGGASVIVPMSEIGY